MFALFKSFENQNNNTMEHTVTANVLSSKFMTTLATTLKLQSYAQKCKHKQNLSKCENEHIRSYCRSGET